MSIFSLDIRCVLCLFQVQRDINLTDRSQTTTNVDSFNIVSSSKLANQSKSTTAKSPLGMLYFYFAWPPRELRSLWLESTPDAQAPSSYDASSISATGSSKSHISWWLWTWHWQVLLSSNKIPRPIGSLRATEYYRPSRCQWQKRVAR